MPQLFAARQGKKDSISEWIQNIQKLSSKLQDCADDERVGIVALANKNIFLCNGFRQMGYKDFS